MLKVMVDVKVINTVKVRGEVMVDFEILFDEEEFSVSCMIPNEKGAFEKYLQRVTGSKVTGSVNEDGILLWG